MTAKDELSTPAVAVARLLLDPTPDIAHEVQSLTPTTPFAAAAVNHALSVVDALIADLKNHANGTGHQQQMGLLASGRAAGTNWLKKNAKG